jgi:hypothetical protein
MHGIQYMLATSSASTVLLLDVVSCYEASFMPYLEPLVIPCCGERYHVSGTTCHRLTWRALTRARHYLADIPHQRAAIHPRG